MPSPDPLKDWLVETWGDTFGPDRSSGRPDAGISQSSRSGDTALLLAPVAVAVAVGAWFAPSWTTQLAADTGEATVSGLVAVADTVHQLRWLLSILAVLGLTVAVWRLLTRRHRLVIASYITQFTRTEATTVRFGFPVGWRSFRSATVVLPRGAAIRDKELEALTAAVRNTYERDSGEYHLSYNGLRSRLTIECRPIPPDTRSARHKAIAEAMSNFSSLKDASVTVDEVDANGIENAYRITFTPTMNTGATAFQNNVGDALAAIAGEHESGRNWVAHWFPSEGYLLLRLRSPLPARVNHPLDMVDEDRRHLPYATAAGDEVMFWDVSTRSNKPHCLIVGPTGGGKTSVIRTLLTEAARRGIPFIGVDPKMIELDGLEGYPGCAGITYDAVRAARLVRAVHCEMMARNQYVHDAKVEPSTLPLLIVVLDEFFILSGKWQRLVKTGDEETREQLKELDPLGAWADLAVLARSAGIRLMLGVQRPDATLFGDASGNARDNFGTRISLGNLSQNGALMMWGDSTVGREVDTSVPGRGVVTGPDGSPVPAQMWWTPNVDRHPNKWGQLSDEEKAIIEGLKPLEAPGVQCYSTELADFLDEERALSKRARRKGSGHLAPRLVPTGRNAAAGSENTGTVILDKEPVEPAEDLAVLFDPADYEIVEEPDQALPEDHEDAVADALPAHLVTAGMTVLVDGPDGDLVPVTVENVDVTYDKKTKAPTETVLTITNGGRVRTHLTYDALGVVFLPDAADA